MWMRNGSRPTQFTTGASVAEGTLSSALGCAAMPAARAADTARGVVFRRTRAPLATEIAAGDFQVEQGHGYHGALHLWWWAVSRGAVCRVHQKGCNI